MGLWGEYKLDHKVTGEKCIPYCFWALSNSAQIPTHPTHPPPTPNPPNPKQPIDPNETLFDVPLTTTSNQLLLRLALQGSAPLCCQRHWAAVGPSPAGQKDQGFGFRVGAGRVSSLRCGARGLLAGLGHSGVSGKRFTTTEY